MRTLNFGSGTLDLVRIPKGRFLMGSRNRLFGEAPPRHVSIDNDFYLAKTPVTRAQWSALMGSDPSAAGDTTDCPVDSISWDLAEEYCMRLSNSSGRRVRLPSEAEWEYACRAGTTTEYFFGIWGPYTDDSQVPHAIHSVLSEYAWFDLNSRGRTRPVGALNPNPWGLYDIIGNVWEWCEDDWHDDYSNAPLTGLPWRDGARLQERRCLRGGAWDMDAFRCRSCYRSYDHRTLGTSRFGLRVAVEA
jgi:eukaryotic-like serine/threonine-protein kinase